MSGDDSNHDTWAPYGAQAQLGLAAWATTVPAGIVVAGADGDVRWANDAALAMQPGSGTDVPESPGRLTRVPEWFAGTDADRVHDALRYAAAGGGDVGAFRAALLDGSGVDVTVTAAEGDVAWVLLAPVVAAPVTESERLESDALLRSSFDDAPIGMALADTSHAAPRYLRVNRAFCDLLGYSEDELLGMDFRTVTHPDDVDLGMGEFGRLLRGETAVTGYEKRFIHRSGEIVWVRLRLSAALGTDGRPTHVIAHYENVTAQRRYEAHLRHLAMHDPLTDLPNRAQAIAVLGEALAASGDHGVTVFYLDLDRFKTINDSLGHDVGDLLLVEMGRRLAALCPSGAVPARLGGDEFVVILTDVCGADAAQDLAERMLRAIEGPVEIGGRRLVVSASIGVVVGRHSDDPHTVLRDADTAMYRAKERGRGRHQVYDTALHHRALAALEVEADLRTALTVGGIEVWYQPIVRLADLEVVGMEALVRLAHPERGVVAPGEFLEVAEDTGLIVPIGRRVLRSAAMQAATCAPHLELAVNVSGLEVAEPSFPRWVHEVLDESGLAHGRLTLEITESVMTGSDEATIRMLTELKRAGVRIAIDDFGTGWSSLSYLRRFPVDVVKVDRSFVAGVADRSDDRAIVRAVVSLARSLGLRTVAEGIETEEQLRWLREIGCDDGQGYLIAMPAPDVPGAAPSGRRVGFPAEA